MFFEPLIAQLAAELQQAELSRVQVGHFSRRFPGMTIEDGYQVARAWVQIKLATGRTTRGHKIGLTSRAMQQASQITEPDYGTLLDDMFIAEGSEIPAARFIAPRVEVELAFLLGRRLQGPGVTIFDVLDATDYVVPAIEIIDARIEPFDHHTQAMRQVFDTIADNAANAGIITGGRPVKPNAVDLRWVSALLYRNGVIEESGVAAAVLNHPATGVAWLAQQAGALGRVPGTGRNRAARFVHPYRQRRGRRYFPCRLRAAGLDRLSLYLTSGRGTAQWRQHETRAP